MANWTTAYVNDLPDSAFLYVESGGDKDEAGKTVPRSLRHFPIKDASGAVDLPHLRNALARIPQSDLSADVKAAATKEAQGLLDKAKGDSADPVLRYDRVAFGKAEVLPNGFLKTDAYLTRTGVFSYLQPDGSVQREFRSPGEVFNTDSLRSLEMVPVTDDHPSTRVDASNAKTLSIGHVGDTVNQVDKFVSARVLITDADAIAKIQAGGKRETSCGYTCDVAAESGVWQGQHYDAVQKNIRYNHVAIVDRGRAGPEVRLRMDTAASTTEQITFVNDTSAASEGTMKIKIDGLDFEVAEPAAQAVAKLQTKLDELQAKCDGLAEQFAKADKERADATAPERLLGLVKERVALERVAAKLIGSDDKLDTMADKEIMVVVVKKFAPQAKLDGVSEAYLKARFDHVVETSADHNDSLARARVVGTAAQSASVRSDADKSREEMLKRQAELWKKPLAHVKGA